MPARFRRVSDGIRVSIIARRLFWKLLAGAFAPLALLFVSGQSASAQSPSGFGGDLNPLFQGILTRPSDLNNTLQYAALAPSSDIESAILGLGNKMTEVVERTEFWMNRGVPSLGCSNGPRATGIVTFEGRRAVSSLSSRAADRVNGWQVQDVESHRLDVVQSRDDVMKCAMSKRCRGGGPREHFVPRAEARSCGIGDHEERL